MIPGIVAAQMPAAGGGGGGGYPGAILAFDFVNGLYFVNEVAVAVADVIDKPGFVTGGVLALRFANETTQGSGVPDIIGDAIAAITPNPEVTFIVDWVETNSNFQSIVFCLGDSSTSGTPSYLNTFEIDRANTGNGGGVYPFDAKSGFGSLRDIFDTGGTRPAGRHRIAVTRTDAKLIMSIDGEATVDSGSGPQASLACDRAGFGSAVGDYLWNEIDIRLFLVYPPADDADLPTLSAL